MRRRSDFALPVKADKVPAGPDWFHEIKHDGYRMMVIRERERVRLLTQGRARLDGPLSLDCRDRAQAEARPVRARRRGGAARRRRCVCRISTGLHSSKHDPEVQLYAFDCLMDGYGDDPRRLPLSMRKVSLGAGCWRGAADGISVAPYESGEIGPDLFRAACDMGLEGLVSKDGGRAYSPPPPPR